MRRHGNAGTANGSPYLRRIIEMVQECSGDVPGDATYGNIKNCNAIHDSGYKTIIDVKLNATPRGFNTRTEMWRFREEHPRTFHNILRSRNNGKGIFSSLRECLVG